MEVAAKEILTLEKKVDRAALNKYEKNKDRDKRAFEICRKKISEHKLAMKLVTAHHLFGEPKILFFFTADSRVDFRGLVKDLVSVFRTRIELRQIGVRDESRVIGGMGVCGRGYCCHTLTDKLNPVSIKMAKKQNLSLNSLKISGPCGRLLCCLSYEYPFYEEAKEQLPAEGMRIPYEGESCKIVEINVLSKEVKLRGDTGRTVSLPVERFRYCEKKRKWEVKTS
jgi:cell fate regulator YaaT (PSP1 superfamily)